MDFYSAYSEKPRVQLTCTTKGRTKQQFKDECDINTIIRRFLKTGVMDFTAKHEPQYGDVTGLEYTDCMNKVVQAKNLFLDLPAALRARFHNEPAEFLDFIQEPANKEEARKLGLLKPEAASSDVPATPPATATADTAKTA